MRILAWSLILLMIMELCPSTEARKERKDKDKKKIHKGAQKEIAQKNLCDVRETHVHVYCYCNGMAIDNATDAHCWIFNGDKDDKDVLWEYFESQRYLETLKLSVRPDCRLHAVPARALRLLQQLRVLEVQYAVLGDIPPYAFANLSTLTQVSLTRNQIVRLSRHSFAHLPRLEQLNLDENRIAELGRDVLVLPELRRLYMDRNNLSVLHDRAFGRLPRLEELVLSSNQLTVLTRDTFSGLKNLKRLDLQLNHLSMLGDGTFSELSSLEELDLDENELELIGDRAFSGLRRLMRLSLAGNHLKALPSDCLQPLASSLRSLDLRENQLQTLPLAVARPLLPRLLDAQAQASLHLDDNNLICDCRLSWMYNLRNETNNEQVRNALEELTCVLAEPFDEDLSTKMSDSATVEPDFVRDAPAGAVDSSVVDSLDEDDDPSAGPPTSLPANRRHLFDIPASLLPCPAELTGGPRSSDAPYLTNELGIGQEMVADFSVAVRIHHSILLLASVVLFSLVT